MNTGQSSPPPQPRRIAWSLTALLAVTFWGASFVATRVALDCFTPGGLVAARMTIGGAVLFVLVHLSGTPLSIARPDRLRVVALGLILALHLLIQSVGLLKTTATNTGWIVGFMPVTIALGSFLFLHTRLSVRGWAGVAVGGAGVALVCLSRGVRFDTATAGDLVQLSSCLTWTAYTLLAVRPITRYGPMTLATWTVGLAAIVLWPVAFIQNVTTGAVTGSAWGAVAFLGVVCTGLAFFMWYVAVRDIGSTAAGTYLYLEPFVTWIVAAVVLGERMTGIGFAGGLIVLAGVWLVSTARAARTAADRHPESP